MILNNIEVEVLAHIELIDVYNKLIPDDFLNDNVIYCIHNKVNGKNYIGQTVNFRNRFSDSYIGHFKDYNIYLNDELKYEKILYTAWKKYGMESFTVYIIESCDNRDALNDRETYWIKFLHTCTKDPDCHGYNLTWGADDIGFLKEGAIEKSLAVRLEKYGSYIPPACHTPEAFEKGNKTKEKRCGHGGFINAFTPEANEKRRQTNLEKYGTTHGPKMSEEALDKMVQKNIEKYGDPMGACNLDPEKRIKNCRISQCFIAIENNQRFSKSYSLEQYIIALINRTSNITKIKTHLLNLKTLFPDLRGDSRWNQDLEIIFKELDNKSPDDIKELVNKISKERAKKNMKVAAEQRERHLRIDRCFKLIDCYPSDSWEDYSAKIIKRYGKYLGEAKVKLIKFINLIPELKKDSRWTDDYERIFGHLGKEDIDKINSLGKRSKSYDDTKCNG